MNPEGVIIRPSPWSVKETVDRLVAFLQAHGATIYARIDQQVEVQNAGRKMAPLEFILFGNPAIGDRYSLPSALTAPLDLDPLIVKVFPGAGDKKGN